MFLLCFFAPFPEKGILGFIAHHPIIQVFTVAYNSRSPFSQNFSGGYLETAMIPYLIEGLDISAFTLREVCVRVCCCFPGLSPRASFYRGQVWAGEY